VDLNSKIQEYEERMSAIESEGKDMIRSLFDDPEVKTALLDPEGFEDFVSLLIKTAERKGYIEEVIKLARSLVGAKNKSGKA
jgi:hypothetical protein